MGIQREGVPRIVFKLDPTSLSSDIFLSAGQLDQVHHNIFVFKSTE